MARLPSRFDLSAPASLRSGRAFSSADTSAIGRGLEAFGAGVEAVGRGAVAAIEGERKRQNTVDLARANAYLDQANIDLLNEFDKDPDYTTFGERGPKKANDILSTAAQMIRDPEARELWQLQAGTQAKRTSDAIVDKGFTLQREADVVAFDEALETQRRIYIDPNSSEEDKAKARASIEGALAVGLGTGLLTPETADRRKSVYLDDADYERAKLDTSIINGSDAASVIKGFEGFRDTPYWDVNAHRVGYGSDTITRADGTVVKVRPGMVVSQEDAERDLQRRITEFQAGIVKKVGVDAWAAMPEAARNALTSVAYNYGELPASVAGAVKSGDVEAVAKAVEGLQDHNDGINRSRRLTEAAIIRGQGEPEYFASLPADQRQVVYDMRDAERKAQATAAAAQAKAEYEAHRSAMELDILTGDVVSEAQVLNDPLIDNDDKATLLRSLRQEQGKTADARALLERIAAGDAALNPFNADDRKIAGDAFDLAMKSLPPEQHGAATAAFIQETGVIPAPVVAGVRQKLSSDKPSDVAAGMQEAAALFDTAPQALDAVEHGKELREAAATYSELVNGRGMSAEQAAAHVLTLRDPAQKRRDEDLKSAWNAAVKDDVFKLSDVTAEFDGGLFVGQPSGGVTPGQQAALNADYLAAAERAFKGPAQGDAGIARRMAVEEMKRTYGVSSVSGSRALMKYPPENFYPARAGGHEYIRDMALKDARSVVPQASNVMLVSTPDTAQDVRSGKLPRYDIYVQDANGAWDLLPDQFTVGNEELRSLNTLDSEERRLRFEIDRAHQEFLSSRGVGGGKIDYSVKRRDMSAEEQRLREIEAERRGVLGRPEEETDDLQQDVDAYQLQYEAGAALGGLPQ